MRMKKSNSITPFLDDKGRIKAIPSPNRTKIPVLSYIAGKFDCDRDYTEKEVNGIIDEWHTFEDHFLVRRLLIDHGFLGRKQDCSSYWVIKKSDPDED